jgi:hypothetical protein
MSLSFFPRLIPGLWHSHADASDTYEQRPFMTQIGLEISHKGRA